MKGLDGLIDIESHALDQKRKALSELRDRAADFHARRDAVTAQIESESAMAGGSVQAAAAFSAFLSNALARRRAIEQTIAELEADIEAAQDAVMEAFRQVKKLEAVQERERQQEALRQRRREQAVTDEVGLSIYRRRDRDSL